MKAVKKKQKFYNLILMLVAVVMIFMVMIGMDDIIGETMALEQSARCGMEEHLHTDECYLGEVLICQKKAHTHSESCYLVLLSDNDINQLLNEVEAAEDKNLETVLNDTLDKATNQSNNVTSDKVVNSKLTSDDISELNKLIAKDDSAKKLVLNEKLSTTSAGESMENEDNRNVSSTVIAKADDTEQKQSSSQTTTVTGSSSKKATSKAAANSGSTNKEITSDKNSTSVTDEEETETVAEDDEVETIADNVAYIYVVLDGELVQVGSINLSTTTSGGGGGSKTVYYCTADQIATVLADYNISESDIRTSSNTNGTYYVRYTTSTPSSSSSFSSTASYSSGNNSGTGRIRFESSGNSVTPPVYITLTTRTQSSSGSGKPPESGSQNTYTPLNFYTVTLEYSDSSEEKEIVLANSNSTLTLSDDYEWYEDEELTTLVTDSSTRLNGITETTILYAKPRAYTAKFVNLDGDIIKDSYTQTPDAERKVSVTLPSLAGTEYEGYYWIVQDGDGTVYASDGTVVVDITRNTTFVAIPSTYTVTYLDFDGNVIKTETEIAYNSQHTVSNELPEGAVAWKMQDGTVYLPEDIVLVDQNLTFQAIPPFTVTYIDENGDETQETVAPGESVVLPVLPDNYVWECDDGNSYPAGTSVTINSDTTFTAKSKCIVTFDSNGGSEVKSQAVTYGGTAKKPTEPTKDGYYLVGWYTDESLTNTYDFSTPVTSNITLYAKWEELPSTRLYHIDLSVEANLTITTYVNGVETTETVKATITPVTLVYEGKNGTGTSGVDSDISVNLESDSSYDSDRGTYEYMMDGWYNNTTSTGETSNKGTARQSGTFYYGGTLTLVYDLEYTLSDGTVVTLEDLVYTEYMTPDKNECQGSQGTNSHGYDLEVFVEDIETSISNNSLTITKIWTGDIEQLEELPNITVEIITNNPNLDDVNTDVNANVAATDGENATYSYLYTIKSGSWIVDDNSYTYVINNLPVGAYDSSYNWTSYWYKLNGETDIGGLTVEGNIVNGVDGFWIIEVDPETGTLTNNYTAYGEALPETGGVGKHPYTQSGGLLTVTATALFIYKKKRIKAGEAC